MRIYSEDALVRFTFDTEVTATLLFELLFDKR